MDTPEGSPKPKPKTLTGLAALGNASVKERLFGPQNTYKEFMALPLLDKLQTIFLKRRNIKENQKPQGGEIRFMRETAAQEALRLSTEERSRLGIRIIAIGPLDENGKLIIDDPKNSRYQICISFPLHNMNHFISLRRGELSNDSSYDKGETESLQSDVTDLDKLITANAELRQETVYDRYTRLVMEIKGMDRFISDEKSGYQRGSQHRRVIASQMVGTRQATNRGEDFNRRKWLLISDYLKAAQQLHDQYPSVAALPYALKDSHSSLHMTLVMQMFRDREIGRRMTDPTTESIPELDEKDYPTDINVKLLGRSAERFRKGSQLDRDRVADEIVTTLGI